MMSNGKRQQQKNRARSAASVGHSALLSSSFVRISLDLISVGASTASAETPKASLN